MKKHNEGYVLVFVLVVTAVLGVFATMFWSLAEINRNAYQSSVASMQDKYQAMGEIEKFIGSLEAYNDDNPVQLVAADEENWKLTYTTNEIQIMSSCDDVQIDCIVLIDGFITADGKITSMDGYSYTSYQISTNGGAGE